MRWNCPEKRPAPRAALSAPWSSLHCVRYSNMFHDSNISVVFFFFFFFFFFFLFSFLLLLTEQLSATIDSKKSALYLSLWLPKANGRNRCVCKHHPLIVWAVSWLIADKQTPINHAPGMHISGQCRTTAYNILTGKSKYSSTKSAKEKNSEQNDKNNNNNDKEDF